MLVERLERGESGVRERAGMKGNVRGCKGGSWGVILGRGGGGGREWTHTHLTSQRPLALSPARSPREHSPIYDKTLRPVRPIGQARCEMLERRKYCMG